MAIDHFKELTIFHFESPRADELGTERKEAEMVAAACKLAGHKFHAFSPLNERSLKEQLEYVFHWEAEEPDKPQFSLHFSNHANSDGLQIGASFLNWSTLAKLIATASDETSFAYMMVISGCGSGRPNLTPAFKALKNRPIYVFTFEDTITWQDAAHASSLIYRFLPDIKVSKYRDVQKIIDHIRTLGFGSLIYFRWDKPTNSYKFYPSTKSA